MTSQSGRGTAIACLLVMGFVIMSGCSKRQEKIDFGVVKNNIYTNKFFGMTIKLPKDWTIVDNKQREMLMDLGVKMMAGKNKKMKKVLDTAKLRTLSLLLAYKHLPDSIGQSNPNLFVSAENLKGFRTVDNAEDFLTIARRNLKKTQLKAEFPGKIQNEKIGGRDFGKMVVNIEVLGIKYSQVYYCTVIKRYALSIVLTYDYKSIPDTEQILKYISFKK
jgi:hypothetical protein